MTKIYLKHNKKKKRNALGRYCRYCFVGGAPFYHQNKNKNKNKRISIKKQRSALDDFSSTNLQLNY